MIVENLTRSQILERLNILKDYIDRHALSLYTKKENSFIRKAVDIWDCNNTVSIIIYRNNTVKVTGEECLLLEEVIKIIKK